MNVRPAAVRLRHLAHELAAHTEPDDVVLGELLLAAGNDRTLCAEALRVPAPSRGSYRPDRARRLLEAAARKEPVAPVPSHDVGLYRWEADLEGLPLGEAFEEVCRVEPRLRALGSDVARHSAATGNRFDLDTMRSTLRWILGSVEHLVGPASGHADRRAASPVASGIARRHLLGVVGLERLPSRSE